MCNFWLQLIWQWYQEWSSFCGVTQPLPWNKIVSSGSWVTKGWRTKGHTWRARDQKVANSAPGARGLHRGGPCDYWRQGMCSPLTGVRLARPWHWTAEAWHLPQAFLVASYRNLWEPVWAKSTFQWLGNTEAHGRQGQRCRRALGRLRTWEL